MAAGVKDANGTISRTEQFDVYDRPVRVTVGVGLTGAENTITEMSYPTASANESKVSKQLDDTRWLTSRTQYDGFGRPVLGSQAEDGLRFSDLPISYTIHAKTIYDGLGRAVKTSNPYRSTGTATSDGWTRMAYDLAGRVIEVASFAGDANTPPPDSGPNSNWTGSVVTSYSGEVTTVRDQANKQRRSTLDALGRLVMIEEMNEYPLPTVYATTSYGYDARGNLLTVTQAQGATTQVRRFAYDLLSRLLFAANPEQETSSNALFSYNNQQWAVKYTYDAASNLTDKSDTRPVGSQFVTVSYQYDGLNRATQRSYNDGTPQVNYVYDTASNGVGRLRSVTATGVSATNYTAYDRLGRVTAYNQATEGQTYLMEATYNKAGLMVDETYPSGKVMHSEYDAAGRPAGIKKQGASFYYAGDVATNATNRVQYTAAGAMSVMKLGNNLWEHTTFNSRLQPTQIGLGVNQTSSSVLGLDYTYSTAGGGEGNDNNGNVRTQTINAAGAVIKQSYSYDVVNRLGAAQESIKTKLQWQQSYSFDRWGNRTGLVNSGPKGGLLPTQSTPAIDSTTNRLAGEMYDGAGNLLSWPQNLTMQYDAESRLVLAREPGALRFEYDGDGRRVKKINDEAGPETTVFVYDVGGRLVAEYVSEAGSLPNVKVSYVTADHLGSTRVVTESNGAVRVRRDYLPYGEEIPATVSGRIATPGYGGSDATRQKFTSKERDSESGLDYFGARYYSSAQGRFICTDPIIATPERFYDPQQFNLYAYTRNNPLRFIDPTGKILTLSGDVNEARKQLCAILGTADCDKRITFDAKTNTFTVDFTGIDFSKNEGAALLNDLISSVHRYDFSVGPTVDTLGGIISLDPNDRKNNRAYRDYENLDNNPDNRYNALRPPGKPDKMKPPKGIDDQIAFNLAGMSPRESKVKGMMPATIESFIFHELAEAYAKVEHNKQYADAHQEAINRETRLRDQRPYLKAHNPGSGPGDEVIIKK